MSSDNFQLHEKLAADCFIIGDLPLCRVLLMNCEQFPWLILVPRRAGKRELFDLEPEDYEQATQEIRAIAEQFSHYCKAHKMNIGALGNQVEQLHVHIIARFTDDAAWPNPVWNSGVKMTHYPAAELHEYISAIQAFLSLR